MNVELGGINDDVSESTYGFQVLALLLQCRLHRGVGAQGMRPPRLTEAPQQGRVTGFQVNDAGRKHPLN